MKKTKNTLGFKLEIALENLAFGIARCAAPFVIMYKNREHKKEVEKRKRLSGEFFQPDLKKSSLLEKTMSYAFSGLALSEAIHEQGYLYS